MRVKSNQFDFVLHREAIQREFVMEGFSFTNKEEFFSAVSVSRSEYGILSTYSSRENGRWYFFVLAAKTAPRSLYEFFQQIKRLSLPSMKRERVSIDANDARMDFVILQLILGSLGSGIKRFMFLPYGNYLGGLYANRIPFTKNATGIRGLKIHGNTIVFPRIFFTRDHTVTVHVESWMPFVYNLDQKKHKMRRFKFVMEFNPVTQTMVQVPWSVVKARIAAWVQSNGDASFFANWYVKGNYLRHTKNSLAYFTLLPGALIDDKLKIFLEFYKNVASELGEFVTLIPKFMDMESFPLRPHVKRQFSLLWESVLSSAALHGIALLSSSSKQKHLADVIYQSLVSSYPLLEGHILHVEQPLSGYWNLQVVEPKEFYKDSSTHCYDGSVDEYVINPSLCLQHITTEKDLNSLDTLLQVTLVELFLKDSLLKKQLPKELWPARDITVAKMRYLHKEVPDGESKKIQDYFALTITKNGEIKNCIHFNEEDFPDSDVKEEIGMKFMTMSFMEQKGLFQQEGIFRFEGNPFSGIFKTTRRPLPDYEKLLDDFSTIAENSTISLSEAFHYMDAFVAQSDTRTKEISSIFEKVKESWKNYPLSASIPVLQWKKAIMEAQKPKRILNAFASFVEEKSHRKYLLQLHTKREKNNPYAIDLLTGIRYSKEPERIFYYAGLRKVGSLGNVPVRTVGTPIRMIETHPSYTFADYANMLDVCWVRTGSKEPTVLPYPFKILNEFIQSEDNRLRNMKDLSD